jgi:predicted ferric reductase
LPGIRLHIHDARQGTILKAEALGATKDSEIWFCGPSGLANVLRNRIRAMGWRPRFHQEAFEMR